MIQITKNFHLSEFDCKDGTRVPGQYYDNVLKVAEQLQVLRDYLGEPVKVLSGYRTPAHNKSVGGVANSQHLTGSAADITVKSKTPRQLAGIVERLIFRGELRFGGMGVYPGFIHLDIRKKKARW